MVEYNDSQKECIRLAKEGKDLKIYGPPGTGKTTTLSGIFSELLKGRNINRIAALAFNVPVADTIAQFSSDITNIPYEMLRKKKWCCTFHAFCKRLLRFYGVDIKYISPYEMAELFVKQKFPKLREEDLKVYNESVNFILQSFEILEERWRKIPTKQDIFNYVLSYSQEYSINLTRLSAILKDLEIEDIFIFREKRFSEIPPQLSFYEFMVYLENFISDTQVEDNFDIIIVDECQDLSPIQWKILDYFNCQKILIGDPAQSIYGWRGAKPKYFTTKSGIEKTLTPSYRYDTAFAEKVEKGIHSLIPSLKRKIYEGIGNKVNIILQSFSVEQINDGVILSRTKRGLSELAVQLDALYKPYAISKDSIFGPTTKEVPMANRLKKVLCFIEAEDSVEKFAENISAGNHIRKKEFKGLLTREKILYLTKNNLNLMKLFDATCKLSINDKIKVFKNQKLDKTVKRQARLLVVPESRIKEYLEDLENPPILLSTIHKFKGLESDKLFIHKFRPLTRAGVDLDEEYRLAYVALTRASGNLTIDYTDNELGVFFSGAK